MPTLLARLRQIADEEEQTGLKAVAHEFRERARQIEKGEIRLVLNDLAGNKNASVT